MSRINTPALVELAAPDDSLTVEDLTDVSHPVNDKGLSGKRKGMVCMIGNDIYLATGSNPDDVWLLISNKFPTGWALYTDTQYTEASPLVVPDGTSVIIDNNAQSKIETYLPTDGPLYDPLTSRVTPNTLGSELSLRVTFKAKGSVNNGGFSVKADISALADSSNIISSVPVRMLKGTGVATDYSVTLDMFSLDTYLANGAVIKLAAEDGDVSIYDIAFFIKKP